MNLGNEYTLVEKPAIDYLKYLGYSYIDGRKLTPENNERHSLSEVINNKKEKLTVKLIDFDNIDNNDFLVANQFKVQGEVETIIPDIVIFINGMPIAVIECKSPFKQGNASENVGKYDGFQQLRRYMNVRDENFTEGAERLFYTNFITSIMDKF